MSGEGLLPVLQIATFLLYPHMAKTDHLSRSSSSKDTNPSIRAPPSRPNCCASQKPHLQIPSHWGLGLQHTKFGGHKYSANNKVYVSSKLSVNIGESKPVCLDSILSQAPSPHFIWLPYIPTLKPHQHFKLYLFKVEWINFPAKPALLPFDHMLSIIQKANVLLISPSPDHPTSKAVARLFQVSHISLRISISSVHI